VNIAGVIVPGVACGRVRPNADLVPAAVTVTVPEVVFATIFPKFKPTVPVLTAIDIGVMIVAVEVAVALTVCPKETAVNPKIAIAKTINFFMMFVFKLFVFLNYFLEYFCVFQRYDKVSSLIVPKFFKGEK
jgi:hypothetical protein